MLSMLSKDSQKNEQARSALKIIKNNNTMSDNKMCYITTKNKNFMIQE